MWRGEHALGLGVLCPSGFSSLNYVSVLVDPNHFPTAQDLRNMFFLRKMFSVVQNLL